MLGDLLDVLNCEILLYIYTIRLLTRKRGYIVVILVFNHKKLLGDFNDALNDEIFTDISVTLKFYVQPL